MADEVIGIDQLTLYDTQLKTYDSTALQMDGTASAGTSKRAARADHVHPTDTSRAPLASPTFTGTPAAPTAATGTNTTQIATTAFVQDAIGSLSTGVTGVKGSAESTYRTGDVNITAANIGVADGAEVNQNAFSNVKVGSTTIEADSKTDTLELAAGSNVTLTPDATGDKVTIAATNTTYSDFTGATSSAAGTHGLVPAPSSGDQGDILFGDGTWKNLGLSSYHTAGHRAAIAFTFNNSGQGTHGYALIVEADSSNSGAMPSAMYSKLNDLPDNATLASTYALKSEISGAYIYKGSVATSADLPSSGQTAGDVYNIEAESAYGPAGTNVAWTGTAWDALGGSFSITYATNAQINALFS